MVIHENAPFLLAYLLRFILKINPSRQIIKAIIRISQFLYSINYFEIKTDFFLKDGGEKANIFTIKPKNVTIKMN